MNLSRFAFVVFVLIGAMGLVMATQSMVNPLSFFLVLNEVAGVDVAAISARDPEAAVAFAFLGRWVGTALYGVDGITLLIAVTAYRRGDRWAWWAMWYWPLMFASHALLYRTGTTLWYAQFLNLSLSLLAQVATARRFSAAKRVGLLGATG
jgi:hypothetical protein